MRRGFKPGAGPLRHGLDTVDGAPNGADIAPGPILGKPEMPDLQALKANLAPMALQIRPLNALLTESREMPPQENAAEPAVRQHPIR